MSTKNERPESLPSDLSPVSKFTFSLSNIEDAEEDLRLQLEAYQTRIDRIIDNVKIKGVNVVSHILGLTQDEEELMVLGKALVKLGPLVQSANDLQSRMNLLDVAKDNPNWFAWVFGDFEEDIEDIISHTADDLD